MSNIQNNGLVGGNLPLTGAAARVTAPVVTGVEAPTVGQDVLGTGLDGMSNNIRMAYQRLHAAQRAGDQDEARAAFQDLKRFAAIGQQYAAGTPYADKFARVNGAVQMANVQYEAAIARENALHPPAPAPGAAGANKPDAPGKKQMMMVGLPGRGGRVVEVETHKTEHKGPFGLLGKLVDKAGSALEGIGHVVFMPLELAGKVLDPVRHAIGGVLSGARSMVDNTLGKIPVIGSAVRFTTGLLNSAVGLVDGAIQGVTHPVELIKGLGSMAYTLASAVPPTMFARMAWDAAVNGKSPMESMKDTYGEVGNIAKGFFANALEDIKQGNYAGALGQVTGDIGSFFVTGGAAGGAKVAEIGSKVSKLAEAAKASEIGGKVAKLAEAAKASELGGKVARVAKVARESEVVAKGAQLAKDAQLGARAEQAANLGLKVMRTSVETSGKIFSLGLEGNFAAWNRVGKAVSGLPGMQKVMTLGTETAGRLRSRFLGPAAETAAGKETKMAGAAKEMDRAKKAASYSPEALGGEVRMAGAPTEAEAVKAQAGVLKDITSTPVFSEGLEDRVMNTWVEHGDEAVLNAFKGVKGVPPVYDIGDVAAAWNKLPENSPARAAIARKLGEAVQQNLSEALHYPPAPMEFSALPENLAGLSKDGKVFIDPAVLNEDLGYLVNTMVEEQTHAYQKFLVGHADAIKATLPADRAGAKAASTIDRYAEVFTQDGKYVDPPTPGLQAMAKRLDQLQTDMATTRKAGESAFEQDVLGAGRELRAKIPAGSPDRAMLDAWWGKVDEPSQRLSFLEYVKKQVQEGALPDPADTRLPQPVRDLVAARALGPDAASAARRSALQALDTEIAPQRQAIEAANREVLNTYGDWQRRYAEQLPEAHAKDVAKRVTAAVVG